MLPPPRNPNHVLPAVSLFLHPLDQTPPFGSNLFREKPRPSRTRDPWTTPLLIQRARNVNRTTGIFDTSDDSSTDADAQAQSSREHSTNRLGDSPPPPDEEMLTDVDEGWQVEELPTRHSEENDLVEEMARERYISATAPTLFPSSNSGDFIFMQDGQPTQRGNVLIPSLDRFPFPNQPSFQLKADVDSIYAYNKDFRTLLRDLGKENSILTLPAITKSTRRMNSSRFFLDVSDSDQPPLLRGSSVQKLSMNRFPSMEIGQLSIGLHRPMSIYLVNCAARTVSDNAFLSKNEVAVINAALNMARQTCKQLCMATRRKDICKSFLDFYRFKSKYGGIPSQGACYDFNELTSEEFDIYSKAVMDCIKNIAKNTTRFAFDSFEYHHITNKDGSPFEASRLLMKTFASELVSGGLFVASLSGIKKSFNRKSFHESNPVINSDTVSQSRFTYFRKFNFLI